MLQNLVRLLREQRDSVKVRADGPYGSSSPVPVWAAHDMLLLIAGGVGVRSYPSHSTCSISGR